MPVSRIDFTRWDLNASTAEATFAFQPTPDERQVEFGDFVTEMETGATPSEPSKA